MAAKKFQWTDRSRLFCQEYLVDLNATQAAIRAGYSKRSANNIGYELMQKSEVRAEIQKHMDKRCERVQTDGDTVLADIRDLADMCLGRKPTSKSVVVEGVPMDFQAKEVNAAGAAKALELLGKHLKLFTDKIEHSGMPTVVIKDFTRGGRNG